ncbi:MAG: serine/threonine-protein phosphatase, partial [Leptospiraceae bacterium]|nr:serine/threonine-protein phosphatase [Leptospiraceae bacterium]
GQYLTAFYLRIDKNKAQYCNATHPEPIVVSPDGKVARLKSNGFYLGMLAETPFEFETGNLEVSKGTKIVIYTDGITEARNPAGEQYGIARLTSTIEGNADKPVADLRAAILSNLAAFAATAPAEDDLTLLVLEF